MRKSRIEARAAAEAKAENNQLDPSENLLGNKTLDNIIKDENLLRDLGILNNKCLQTIVAKTMYEWRSSNIQENFAITATLHMWNAI